MDHSAHGHKNVEQAYDGVTQQNEEDQQNLVEYPLLIPVQEVPVELHDNGLLGMWMCYELQEKELNHSNWSGLGLGLM